MLTDEAHGFSTSIKLIGLSDENSSADGVGFNITHNAIYANSRKRKQNSGSREMKNLFRGILSDAHGSRLPITDYIDLGSCTQLMVSFNNIQSLLLVEIFDILIICASFLFITSLPDISKYIKSVPNLERKPHMIF